MKALAGGFALGTLAPAPGARTARPVAAVRIALDDETAFWPLADAARHAGVKGVPDHLMALFDDWDGSLERIERVVAAIRRGRVPAHLAIPERHAKLLTPLRYPRKALFTGANYADHLVEMNAASIRKIQGVPPFFFMKPPSTALVGPGRTVRIPSGCQYFDWEAEVVAVIGRGGRDIPVARALRHVAAYSVGIDFTARDLFVQPESFFKFNFTLGKSQDTMSPLGPVVVPAAFLPSGPALEFGLWVNGVPKQRASTADMIYSLAEQIAGISRSVSVEPGDVIFTGSPAGVGLPRGEKLAPGDRVRVAADYVGEMEVVIRG